MSGVGVRVESCSDHFELSSETNVVSFAGALEAAAGVRREIVSTRLMAELEIRLERMWEPCARRVVSGGFTCDLRILEEQDRELTTMPVHPISAAFVILAL